MRTTIDDMLARARSRYARLQPEEAYLEAGEGATIVDLRCPSDRARLGAPAGSVPVPRAVLEWRIDPDSPWRDERISDLDARLILICNDGFQSSLAVSNLIDLGFTSVTDVDGGANGWSEAGVPLKPA